MGSKMKLYFKVSINNFLFGKFLNNGNKKKEKLLKYKLKKI